MTNDVDYIAHYLNLDWHIELCYVYKCVMLQSMHTSVAGYSGGVEQLILTYSHPDRHTRERR